MIKKSIEKCIATIAVTTVALTSLFTAAAPLPRTLSIEFADIKGLVNPRYSVTEQLNRNIDYRPYKLTFHIWRDPFSAEYARYIAEYLCEIYTADKNAWLFHRFKTVEIQKRFSASGYRLALSGADCSAMIVQDWSETQLKAFFKQRLKRF